jgi:hypothetical protein
MKIILAVLGAHVLIGCGGESDANVTLRIDPPPDGDNSCVGVAGFEVTVSQPGHVDKPAQLVGKDPILDAKACALPEPFPIQGLDLGTPVSVTVRGYDGTGTASRVSASTTIGSLRESPAPLALRASSPPPPPVLVFYRNAVLGNTPLSDVTNILISKQMQAEDLLSVDAKSADPYFTPEPGAYGIPSGLAADGSSTLVRLSVTFSTASGQIKGQITTEWRGTYYFAR